MCDDADVGDRLLALRRHRLADDLHRRRRAETRQRKKADCARGFDAGQRVDLLEEPVEELRSLTIAAVARLRQRHPHRHRARGVEPGAPVEQANEAAQQKTCADEEHERQRDLDDHEGAARAVSRANRIRSARRP